MVNKRYQILPSLLSANTMQLAEEAKQIMQAGADMLHVDVMDNHYVPNLTFGPWICQGLRQLSKSWPIDVHLMVTAVDDLIQKFATAGATRISIHPETTYHLDRSLQLIKTLKVKAGLVLNPATSLDWIKWVRHHLDFVLVMTVNPGFGGQTLISEIIYKISELHRQYPDLAICVDGGINLNNIRSLAHAGATEFVAGSSIFNSNDYSQTIADFRKQLES